MNDGLLQMQLKQMYEKSFAREKNAAVIFVAFSSRTEKTVLPPNDFSWQSWEVVYLLNKYNEESLVSYDYHSIRFCNSIKNGK